MLSREQIKTVSTEFLEEELVKSIELNPGTARSFTWKIYIDAIKTELKKRKGN